MNTSLKTIAQNCLRAAEDNSQAFPQIVETLMNAGFEGYNIDFRRAVSIYYCPGGETIEFSLNKAMGEIEATFNASAIQAAVREAQEQAPGYSYAGFCTKLTQAGCAGYVVSFLGRRVLYFGRTAETHVEHFPGRN
ncbi:DUF1398 family protein [Vampirovibrio sp.]|uniref:DUF1398 family protein n=1 Tax=Vampirovibrio sp. TaxID=2717857 RepID=UPI00359477A6